MFLDDRDGKTQITFGELDRRARLIAARLQLELKPGDRALLVYPAGLEFISAFFGCMYAGVVAVPATYPKPKRPMPRLQRIAVDCDAHVALSTAQTLTTLDPELLSADAATNQWIATDELTTIWPISGSRPTIDKNDLAFLQYTSGSTSDPKGVMVSHGNLLTNLDCIRQSFGIGEIGRRSAVGDRCVLAARLSRHGPDRRHPHAAVHGRPQGAHVADGVLAAAHAVAASDSRLSTTISGAPNFAYEYCVRRTSAEERATLDLSHWRLAFCGAEPIRAETLVHFAEAFRDAGFKLQVVLSMLRLGRVHAARGRARLSRRAADSACQSGRAGRASGRARLRRAGRDGSAAGRLRLAGGRSHDCHRRTGERHRSWPTAKSARS